MERPPKHTATEQTPLPLAGCPHPSCAAGLWRPQFLLPTLVARCAVPSELNPARLPTSPSECVFCTVGCFALEFQTMLNLLVLWVGISGAAPQMLNV